MKYLGFFKKIVYALVIILLVIVCFVTATSVFEVPGGYRFFMVESGSMEPAIKSNSVVLMKKMDEYKVGDIIAFNTNSGQPLTLSSVVVVHRIYEFADNPQKGKLIITKGDANQTPDAEPIKNDQILGKVFFGVPYLGRPIKFAKSQIGFIALVVVPGTLIVYSELINIKNEIVKIIENKKKNKQKKGKTKDIEKKKVVKKKSKNIKKRLIGMTLLLFLTSFSLQFVMPAKAFYSDTEVSKDNVIAAGTWDVTIVPIEIKPGDIVINEVYYDVDSFHGDDGNISTSDEWIELYNNLDQEVSLENWTISDNTDTRTIGTGGKIPAKGFAIISKEIQTWTYWPTIPSSAERIELGQIIGGGLANSGDRVVLKNNTNVEIDAVSWGTDTYAFNPSVVDVPEGHSISRIQKGVDTNLALDWMDTYSGSTPPGPNPGTNPHNQDGTLVTPSLTPVPEAVSTASLEASFEATSSPFITSLPSLSPTTEESPSPLPTAEPTTGPEPEVTPEVLPSFFATPIPTPESSPVEPVIEEPSPSPTTEESPSPLPTAEPTTSSEATPLPSLPPEGGNI